MKKQKFETYTQEELHVLRQGGQILREILLQVKDKCHVGVTTGEVDKFAEKLINEKGAVAVFKNYKPLGASYPYPAVSCISVNNQVAHGIPGQRVFCDGDVVSLDIGIRYKGLVVDSAITFGIGELVDKDKKLINITEQALSVGIGAVRDGVYVNDIGKAIEKFLKGSGFRVVPILCGHAVGRHIHSDPQIPHIDMGHRGDRLSEGMVIAIEPHVTSGNGSITLSDVDDWTYHTDDGTKTAQFEHTVYITKEGVEILT